MNIKIIDKNGVTLKTKGKYCKEDISVSVDDSILGITPTGTYEVTDNGEYDITEYAKVNVNVAGSGGDTTKEDGLVTRTLTEYTNNNVTEIGDYIFVYNNNLKNVSFSKVTKVGKGAFGQCENLINVNIPQLETIGYGTFDSCKSIVSINFSNVKTIGEGAFQYCTGLTDINIPNVETIGRSAFNSCKFTSISLPLLKTVTNNLFPYCSNLISVYTPQITYIERYAFSGCNSLKAVIITQETKVCTLYDKAVFQNCYHILGTVNSTYNPNGDKDGFIYVPDSLLDQYKQSTNWSNFADQIKPLSELPQEYKTLYNIA